MGTQRSTQHTTVWAELTLGRSGRGGHASHLTSQRDPQQDRSETRGTGTLWFGQLVST